MTEFEMNISPTSSRYQPYDDGASNSTDSDFDNPSADLFSDYLLDRPLDLRQTTVRDHGTHDYSMLETEMHDNENLDHDLSTKNHAYDSYLPSISLTDDASRNFQTKKEEGSPNLDAVIDRIKEVTNTRNWFSIRDEVDVVIRDLELLTPTEIESLKQRYQPNDNDALKRDLKSSLDEFSLSSGGARGYRWAAIEGHLNRTGKPGEFDAIDLRVDALKVASDLDVRKAKADTRRILLSASEQGRQDIETAMKDLYGVGSLREHCESSAGRSLYRNIFVIAKTGLPADSITDPYMYELLRLTATAGVDKRSAQDQLSLANAAMQTGNLERYREAAGSNATTPEGRELLRSNSHQAQLQKCFKGDELKEALDISRLGKLSAITKFEKGIGVVSNVDDALTDALKHADPDEKERYVIGKRLATAGEKPKTTSDSLALDEYERWQKAFKSAASFLGTNKILNLDRRIAKYEDLLTSKEGEDTAASGRFYELGSDWWRTRWDHTRAVYDCDQATINRLCEGISLTNGRPDGVGYRQIMSAYDTNASKDWTSENGRDLINQQAICGFEIIQAADAVLNRASGRRLEASEVERLQKVPAFQNLSSDSIQTIVDQYQTSNEPLACFLRGREQELKMESHTASISMQHSNPLEQSTSDDINTYRTIRFEAIKSNARQDLLSALKQNTYFIGNDNEEAIFDALTNANHMDRNKYLHDKQYAKDVDQVLESNLNERNLSSARLILKTYSDGTELNAVESATVAISKAQAAKDLSTTDVLKMIREALGADKTGQLHDQFKEDRTFKQTVSSIVGGAYYDRYVEPLLKDERVPLSAWLEFHETDKKKIFKDAILDANSKELAYINGNSGDSDRRRLLAPLNPQEKALAEHIFKQGVVKPEDRLRAFVIGLGESEDAPFDCLKSLSSEDRIAAVRNYQSSFDSCLREDLRAKVGKEHYLDIDRLAQERTLDSEQAVTSARREVIDSTMSWLGRWGLSYDARPVENLAELEIAERDHQWAIPQEQLDARLAEICENLDSFDKTKDNLADLTTEAVVMGVSLAAAPFTGGTSLTVLARLGQLAEISVTGGLAGAYCKAQLTGDYKGFATDVFKYSALTAANFAGAECIANVSRLGNKVAATTFSAALRTAGLEGVSDQVQTQIGKRFTSFVNQSIVKHGGVSDDAVRQFAKEMSGLSAAQQEKLAAGLIENLGSSVKQVTTWGARDVATRLTRGSQVALLEGAAAYPADSGAEVVRELVEYGKIDPASVTVAGLSSFAGATAFRGGFSMLGAGKSLLGSVPEKFSGPRGDGAVSHAVADSEPVVSAHSEASTNSVANAESVASTDSVSSTKPETAIHHQGHSNPIDADIEKHTMIGSDVDIHNLDVQRRIGIDPRNPIDARFRAPDKMDDKQFHRFLSFNRPEDLNFDQSSVLRDPMEENVHRLHRDSITGAELIKTNGLVSQYVSPAGETVSFFNNGDIYTIGLSSDHYLTKLPNGLWAYAPAGNQPNSLILFDWTPKFTPEGTLYPPEGIRIADESMQPSRFYVDKCPFTGNERVLAIYPQKIDPSVQAPSSPFIQQSAQQSAYQWKEPPGLERAIERGVLIDPSRFQNEMPAPPPWKPQSPSEKRITVEKLFERESRRQARTDADLRQVTPDSARTMGMTDLNEITGVDQTGFMVSADKSSKLHFVEGKLRGVYRAFQDKSEETLFSYDSVGQLCKVSFPEVDGVRRSATRSGDSQMWEITNPGAKSAKVSNLTVKVDDNGCVSIHAEGVNSRFLEKLAAPRGKLLEDQSEPSLVPIYNDGVSTKYSQEALSLIKELPADIRDALGKKGVKLRLCNTSYDLTSQQRVMDRVYRDIQINSKCDYVPATKEIVLFEHGKYDGTVMSCGVSKEELYLQIARAINSNKISGFPVTDRLQKLSDDPKFRSAYAADLATVVPRLSPFDKDTLDSYISHVGHILDRVPIDTRGKVVEFHDFHTPSHQSARQRLFDDLTAALLDPARKYGDFRYESIDDHHNFKGFPNSVKHIREIVQPLTHAAPEPPKDVLRSDSVSAKNLEEAGYEKLSEDASASTWQRFGERGLFNRITMQDGKIRVLSNDDFNIKFDYTTRRLSDGSQRDEIVIRFPNDRITLNAEQKGFEIYDGHLRIFDKTSHVQTPGAGANAPKLLGTSEPTQTGSL